MMVRFTDDHICCFQHDRNLQKLRRTIDERLEKTNLELSKKKTRVVKFTRFETKNSDSFTFLGFEYRWEQHRKGKPLVKMQAPKKKFRLVLSSIMSEEEL